MTTDEIMKLADDYAEAATGHDMGAFHGARESLRAALEEQPAEQSAKRGEPVGEVRWAADVPDTVKEVRWADYAAPPVGTKLYTAPQPAKRVQLTRAEIINALAQTHDFDSTDFDTVIEPIARAIERAHGINVPQARGETK